MNKVEIIELLRVSRKAHLKWVTRASALVDGFKVEKEAIPMASTDCVFGQWFYGDGQDIKLIMASNKAIFHNIEELHNDCMKFILRYLKYILVKEILFFQKYLKYKKKCQKLNMKLLLNIYIN